MKNLEELKKVCVRRSCLLSEYIRKFKFDMTVIFKIVKNNDFRVQKADYLSTMTNKLISFSRMTHDSFVIFHNSENHPELIEIKIERMRERKKGLK